MAIRFIYFFGIFMLLLGGCSKPQVLDVNQSIKDNSWLYSEAIKADFEIMDSLKSYQVALKLRNTHQYKYEDLYVLMRLNGPGLKKQIRYKFQMANAKGVWLGKGSGDRFQLTLPLYASFKFPHKGKYSLEIEHNMDENPLVGVSDVGLNIVELAP